jgi:hypothetical protein
MEDGGWKLFYHFTILLFYYFTILPSDILPGWAEFTIPPRGSWKVTFFVNSLLIPPYSHALRPGGPRRLNAAAPGAISLRSMAPVKAAYEATVTIFFIIEQFVPLFFQLAHVRRII